MIKYDLVYDVSYRKFFSATIQEVKSLKLDLKGFVELLEYKSFFEFVCLISQNNNSNLKYCGYQLQFLRCLHFLSILIKIDVVLQVRHQIFEWVWLFM